MTGLGSADVMAFVATTDITRARSFYGDVLGLRLMDEDPYACVFDANGTILRVVAVAQLAPAPFTVLGWVVDDIRAAVDGLRERGVAFERYDGMDQDDHDVWQAPGGVLVGWFRDPDGNTLSLTELAASK